LLAALVVSEEGVLSFLEFNVLNIYPFGWAVFWWEQHPWLGKGGPHGWWALQRDGFRDATCLPA